MFSWPDWRGLDARPVDEKRIGDFEPCHRIAIFTEPAPRLYEHPFKGVVPTSGAAGRRHSGTREAHV